MAIILPDTTLRPGDIERNKDPLTVALAKLHAVECALQMEVQRGSRRGSSLGVRYRMEGEVYRTLKKVERLAKGRNNLPDEIIEEIKDARLRFPEHPQA